MSVRNGMLCVLVRVHFPATLGSLGSDGRSCHMFTASPLAGDCHPANELSHETDVSSVILGDCRIVSRVIFRKSRPDDCPTPLQKDVRGRPHRQPFSGWGATRPGGTNDDGGILRTFTCNRRRSPTSSCCSSHAGREWLLRERLRSLQSLSKSIEDGGEFREQLPSHPLGDFAHWRFRRTASNWVAFQRRGGKCSRNFRMQKLSSIRAAPGQRCEFPHLLSALEDVQ